MTQLLAASLAPATKKCYNRAWNQYREFCSSVLGSTVIFPVPVHTLCLFVTYMHDLGYAPRTVSTSCSAISYCHKLQNYPDPAKSFIIGKLLASIHKTRVPDIRRPISVPVLQSLILSLESICDNTFDRTLFSAMFSINFHAMLRLNELLNCLMVSNISFVSTNEVHLKLDQFKHSKGPVVLMLSSKPDRTICPVLLLRTFIQKRGNKPGHLFSRPGGDSITRSQYCQLLQRAVQFCSLNPRHYTSHSFRIGAATAMAAQGIPEDTIKNAGRWHSAACRNYIRLPSVNL